MITHGLRCALIVIGALMVCQPASAQMDMHAHADHMAHHHGNAANNDIEDIPATPGAARDAHEAQPHCPAHAGKPCTCSTHNRLLMACNASGCCIKDGSAMPANLTENELGDHQNALLPPLEMPPPAAHCGIAPYEQLIKTQIDISPVPRPPAL